MNQAPDKCELRRRAVGLVPLKTCELMKVQNLWEVPGIWSAGRCLINQNTLCHLSLCHLSWPLLDEFASSSFH